MELFVTELAVALAHGFTVFNWHVQVQHNQKCKCLKAIKLKHLYVTNIKHCAIVKWLTVLVISSFNNTLIAKMKTGSDFTILALL